MKLARPPVVAKRTEWQPSSGGWNCREVYYDNGKRRRRYVGHLGQKRFAEICADATMPEIRSKLLQWLESRKSNRESEPLAIPVLFGDF